MNIYNNLCWRCQWQHIPPWRRIFYFIYIIIKWQICLRAVDFYRIRARKSNLPGKNENIQGRCIPSACQSVYREIFVPHRETVKLPSKWWVSRQNRETKRSENTEGTAINPCTTINLLVKSKAEVVSRPFRLTFSFILRSKPKNSIEAR